MGARAERFRCDGSDAGRCEQAGAGWCEQTDAGGASRLTRVGARPNGRAYWNSVMPVAHRSSQRHTVHPGVTRLMPVPRAARCTAFCSSRRHTRRVAWTGNSPAVTAVIRALNRSSWRHMAYPSAAHDTLRSISFIPAHTRRVGMHSQSWAAERFILATNGLRHDVSERNGERVGFGPIGLP